MGDKKNNNNNKEKWLWTPKRQQPNAKSQHGSGDYNCVGFTGSKHRTTSWFLFSEMREGMQRSDDGGLRFRWRMGE
jgi:hypothetical protein